MCAKIQTKTTRKRKFNEYDQNNHCQWESISPPRFYNSTITHSYDWYSSVNRAIIYTYIRSSSIRKGVKIAETLKKGKINKSVTIKFFNEIKCSNNKIVVVRYILYSDGSKFIHSFSKVRISQQQLEEKYHRKHVIIILQRKHVLWRHNSAKRIFW